MEGEELVGEEIWPSTLTESRRPRPSWRRIRTMSTAGFFSSNTASAGQFDKQAWCNDVELVSLSKLT